MVCRVCSGSGWLLLSVCRCCGGSGQLECEDDASVEEFLDELYTDLGGEAGAA